MPNWLSDAVNRVGGWLNTSGRVSAAEHGPYGGIDRSNYDLPGYDARQQQLADYAAQNWNKQAPTAGTFQADESGFRQNQQNSLNDLWERAQGQKSLAAEQLRQESARNIAQQQGFAASARPGQQAMMARTAAQNAGRINQGMAGQTANARLAEMMGASQLGGQLAGQARGQDLQRGIFNAGQQQQGGQFNADLNMQQQQLNQQGWLEALRQQTQNAGLQQGGGMGYEGQRGLRWGVAAGQPTRLEQVLSAGASVLAGGPKGGK